VATLPFPVINRCHNGLAHIFFSSPWSQNSWFGAGIFFLTVLVSDRKKSDFDRHIITSVVAFIRGQTRTNAVTEMVMVMCLFWAPLQVDDSCLNDAIFLLLVIQGQIQHIHPQYINVTDRQTDGRLTIATPRFALRASRGKN